METLIKKPLTAAERKRISRQNKLKKMTPEKLKEYNASENERRSHLCREQKAKMTPEDLKTYLLKDSTRKAVKKKEKQLPTPDFIKFPTPYRARQVTGKQ